jgi:nucleoid-associated protein YgaU
MLKQELDGLRVRLGEIQEAKETAVRDQAPPAKAPAPKATGKATAAAQATASTSTAALQPAPPQAAVDTYSVAAGDTLSRIAGKVYSDPSRWEEIFNANRATLPSPQSLKVGQTLVIPRK